MPTKAEKQLKILSDTVKEGLKLLHESEEYNNLCEDGQQNADKVAKLLGLKIRKEVTITLRVDVLQTDLNQLDAEKFNISIIHNGHKIAKDNIEIDCIEESDDNITTVTE